MNEWKYNRIASRYYLIGKSMSIDYPHYYGHYPNSKVTQVDFQDRAGDNITKSASIYGVNGILKLIIQGIKIILKLHRM